jgi:hydrogenase small subunit
MEATSMNDLRSFETPVADLPLALDRRSFVKTITMAAAAVGLGSHAAARMVEAAVAGVRPSVIWLHFQECTGCTESLLRTSHPDLAKLILDLVSLDYHETLMAAAGHQAEAALEAAMKANAGKYICVVEGAVPTKDDGIYCMIGGKTALELVNHVADQAGAIVAIGSCASWGGIPSADPNPTGATGAPMVLKGKTVVTLPGCPANPYIFLGTALQYVALGSLPALDDKGRPTFAYGRTIHEHCPRRAHFDAGRFVQQFGDDAHRQGHCLYKIGCKGPATHASCSTLHFGDVVDAWPIGLGHPCFGCTEQQIGFRMALHDTVTIERPTPPDTYPPIAAEQGKVGAVATGIAGLAVGAALGAGYRFAKSLGAAPASSEKPGPDEEVKP